MAKENWFEANKETIRLILAVTAKEIEELTPEDIQHFPCNDLMVIDRLWMKYSNDRFGFSPQLKIYLDNSLTTVMVIFTVKPEQQQEVIDTIKEFLETVKTQPGFSKDKPYWDGIAENEYHLYEVVYTVNS